MTFGVQKYQRALGRGQSHFETTRPPVDYLLGPRGLRGDRILIGCQQTPPPETKSPKTNASVAPLRAPALEGKDMKTDTPLATVQTYLDAFNRGDVKAMAEAFA